MANLNNELQLLLRALDNAGVSTQKFSRKIQEAGDNQEKLVSLVREMQQALNDAEGSAGNLYQRLRAITGELGSKNKALNTSISAYNRLTQLAGQLRDDEAGILDLNKNQLKRLERKLSINKQLLKDEAQRLKNGDGLSAAGKEYLDFLEEAADAAGLEGEARAEYLKNGINRADEFNDKQKAILSSYYDQHKEVEELEKLTEERLRLEKIISKNMGVTGALVGGTGALMERLGMRSGIFHDAMEEATETMRMQAKILGENATLLDRMGIAATGFSIVARGFGQALFDPAVLTGKILDGFLEVNKAQVEFTRLTGQASKTLGGVNTEVASMADMLKSATEFTRQTGLNAAAIFTPQQIGQIADATELLGISADQATQLGFVMKQTGKSADEIGNAIYANVDAGISQKAVYDDVLSASDDIVASSGGNVEALGRAASAARKLGMDLQKINQIADGLLDFESSIEKELEAQLLTGKNINLAKARELALNNDLEGVAEELAKNGASAAEFAKMNRIQQKALAEAMGMSREELGKMVLTQEAMANMSDEEIARARGMTLEQSKQLDIQTRIQKSVDRLAQAFAPILEAVVPIVEALLSVVRPIAAIVGWALKWKAVSYALTGIFATIAASMAAMKIANFVGVGVRGFNAMRESLSGMKEGIKSLPGLLGKVKKGFSDAFNRGMGKVQAKSGQWYDKNSPQGKMITNMKKGGGKDLAEEAAESTSKASKSTKAVKPGKNIKTFLKNLAEGLKEMASMKVLYGALNLIPASLGLVAMIPGVIGAKLMEIISGPKLLASMQSLALGLTAMGTGKVLLGTLALLGAATAFTLMIPASLGMLLLGAAAPIAAAGIYALIPALVALGTAMVSGVGALGLVALIGLAVGAGAAFALMGAGAMMLGMGIKYAAEGISLIFSQFSGLVGILPQIYALIPALFGLAAGLTAIGIAGLIALPGLLALALGSGGLSSMVSQLIGLAAVAPQLMLVGLGLMSIAAGLGMIAVAGIAAIPALTALSAFALVAAPLAALAGLFGEGENEDNSMAEISAKLDTLISVVSAGGNVYLDGNKVGEAQVLGTYKLS